MADMPPPATDFERELDAQIREVWNKGSGTVWTQAARVVANHFGIDVGEVGLISVTDDGVKNNRPLSAGLITAPRRLVLIPVADEVGLETEEEAVVNLMPKTRHLTTVGIAALAPPGPDGGEPIWRVQRLVEIEGMGIADEIVGSFPMVSEIRREKFVPFGDRQPPSREPWLVSISGTPEPSIRVILPPTDPNRRCVTPGDRVLLCNADQLSAVGFGVVQSIERSGADVEVLIEEISRFREPVSMAGSGS